MTITKSKRALISIINVQDNVPKNVRWLYQFIDASGAVSADLLAINYGQYKKLYGKNATRARFLNALESFGGDDAVGAIDVLVMIHGLDGKLVFADATYESAELAAEIKALNLAGKLRLLYSTACYGFSHTGDFVNAGFSAAVGAKKVNANAATEVPVLFSMWAAGASLKDAVAKGDLPLTREAADKAAEWFGKLNKTAWRGEVDSEKIIIGSNGVTIASDA